MVCLGNSVIFEIASSTAFHSFVDYDGYSISSEGFLPTVVDIMVIWVNTPIPVHFSLLIPKMSMFTLAISSFITSNLPCHRTGKGQFSFHSQRKAMPKKVQTTAQLHSSHMLAKYCSNFSKPDFSNMWTMNFQMFNLILERKRNQRSNCHHPLDHQKSKRVPEKHLFLLYWLYQSLWLYGSLQTVENS